MVSKIIKLEKERQEMYLNRLCDIEISPINMVGLKNQIMFHKQSLINLKEYIEEITNGIEKFIMDGSSYWEEGTEWGYIQFHKDIDELNKMIEKYGN